MPRVRALQQTLAPPIENVSKETVLDSISTGTAPPAESAQAGTKKTKADIMPCGQQYPGLTVRGGIEQFMESIEYPNSSTDAPPEGEIVYTLTITPEGKVSRYDQVNPNGWPGHCSNPRTGN